MQVVFYLKQVSRNRPYNEIREPTDTDPRPRRNTSYVDDELARLKREMGG